MSQRGTLQNWLLVDWCGHRAAFGLFQCWIVAVFLVGLFSFFFSFEAANFAAIGFAYEAKYSCTCNLKIEHLLLGGFFRLMYLSLLRLAKQRQDRRPLYRRIFTNRRLDLTHRSKYTPFLSRCLTCVFQFWFGAWSVSCCSARRSALSTVSSTTTTSARKTLKNVDCSNANSSRPILLGLRWSNN